MFWCCSCLFFWFSFCFSLSLVSCFFWGFTGQARRPKGPLHLALNSPHLLLFCLFVFFLCFPFYANRKNLFSPSKRACLFIILCICFSIAFCFGFPLFHFPLFHFLFLRLSLSLSLLFSSFFLPSCFSCQFWVLAFCFCLVWFLFQDVLLFCFSACYLVLFWITIFNIFSLHLVFFAVAVFCFCCFGVCYFWMLATYQKHLSNIWEFQNPQNEKCRNNGHFGLNS